MNSMANQLIKVLPDDARQKIGENIANEIANEMEDYILKGMVTMTKDFSKTESASEYGVVLVAMRKRMAERLSAMVVKIEKFNG